MRFDLHQGMALLERTPAVLTALLDGQDERWTRADEGPETWRPFDVVNHLIDTEETNWLPRAHVILGDDADKRFPPFDRFRHLGRNQDQSLSSLLDHFRILRSTSLAELRTLNLGPAELARTGRHPEFGEVTLEQLLATWVVHDLTHLSQVVRVMAKQYSDAVGPWRAYLTVLKR